MVLKPAPAGTGILFRRVDLGPDAIVEALAENISSTARSTTISKGEASVATIEHIMSALTGMGVDNAIIDIDNVEVPILDGSARFYVEAIAASGTVEQDALREYVDIPEEIEVRDEKTGSFVRVTPSDKPGIDVTNLVKGGDMDNAIVIAENPVTEGQLSELSALFNVPKLEVKEGYLNNLQLRFPDECGRHKLLDLVGDLRLAGGYLNAKVTAFKPGHTINSQLTKAIRERIR